jgi:hypothetical protein
MITPEEPLHGKYTPDLQFLGHLLRSTKDNGTDKPFSV